MKTEKLELFANNEVIYKTLIDGPTSRKELADVVSAVYGKKKTASYDIIKELLNDENGMLSVEGDILSLNQDEFDEFMDELQSSYASKSISEKMTKPSEVALKQEFAEELIKGQWYITAECNGEKKKYQLMPVDEYNTIRDLVLGIDADFKSDVDEL